MKNKIHNFGQLGKWSEDTLLANADKGRFSWGVNLIDEQYYTISRVIDNQIEDIENMKIPVQGGFKRYIQFKNLGSQYDYQNILQMVNKCENNKKELGKCLEKYRIVMNKLWKKGKRK